MADRIQLLPDNIANQIAAGEVIQRPASAVKELLENAVDAGATEIRLLVNDAGKSLIQVTDNGSGMSDTDARMCFERHATSKIRDINDLFHIRTMGFRGEALASIAAVSQVELKTRREEDTTGTLLQVENSRVLVQEPVAAARGTTITMKNLFFNVPARRNFLKSNAAEMRHIVDEFIRVALAFPGVFFSLTSNGQQVFHLETGSLKQRILQLLGNQYGTRLVPVKENTDYLNVYGFAGKPETAKKTRGEQYFFVNNRFIKSPYLNHAVMSAYQDMITPDSYPAYVLFIDLDPEQVDVNVHPTKQEIKFEDEKIVYAFIHAAVKHALAQFSITPTLDFELDPSIQGLDAIQKPFTSDKQAATQSSSIFRTFTEAHQAHRITSDAMPDPFPTTKTEQFSREPMFQRLQFEEQAPLLQLFNTYIMAPAAEQFILVHQQSAHERVIYERLLQASEGKPVAAQRSLFPVTLDPSPSDAVILQELLPDLHQVGYLIEPFGNQSFVIQGTPADVEAGNEKQVLEKIIEQYKFFSSELKLPRREMLIRSVASQQSIKSGTPLTQREMQQLLTDLFECRQSNSTPTGRPTYLEFKKEQLEKMFGRF